MSAPGFLFYTTLMDTLWRSLAIGLFCKFYTSANQQFYPYHKKIVVIIIWYFLHGRIQSQFSQHSKQGVAMTHYQVSFILTVSKTVD